MKASFINLDFPTSDMQQLLMLCIDLYEPTQRPGFNAYSFLSWNPKTSALLCHGEKHCIEKWMANKAQGIPYTENSNLGKEGCSVLF